MRFLFAFLSLTATAFAGDDSIDHGIVVGVDERPADALSPENRLVGHPSRNDVGKSIVRCRRGDTFFSGVIITEAGIVLTAKSSAVSATEPITVRLSDGRSYVAKFVAACDAIEGPVLLQLPPGKYQAAPIGAKQNKKGERCWAMGYAYGQALSSRVGRMRDAVKLNALRGDNGFWVNSVDMQVLPGYSGGPLLNDSCEIIGLSSTTGDGESQFITLTDIQSTVQKHRQAARRK